MDNVVDENFSQTPSEDATQAIEKPSRAEAEKAVRTLIAWAGDDPEREGLIETPKRVVNAYNEFFEGYDEDPVEILSKTFEEVADYDDMVMLRNIQFNSHCEHHMVPIIGTAHIAYMPNGRVVGISKLARALDIFAKRLQTQETMTAQISNAINNSLDPAGVAILVEADHQCMSTRGVSKADVSTITTQFTGVFKEDMDLQKRFLDLTRR